MIYRKLGDIPRDELLHYHIYGLERGASKNSYTAVLDDYGEAGEYTTILKRSTVILFVSLSSKSEVDEFSVFAKLKWGAVYNGTIEHPVYDTEQI